MSTPSLDPRKTPYRRGDVVTLGFKKVGLVREFTPAYLEVRWNDAGNEGNDKIERIPTEDIDNLVRVSHADALSPGGNRTNLQALEAIESLEHVRALAAERTKTIKSPSEQAHVNSLIARQRDGRVRLGQTALRLAHADGVRTVECWSHSQVARAVAPRVLQTLFDRSGGEVNKIAIGAVLVAGLAGCARPVTSSPERPVFTIIEHHTIPASDSEVEREEYTVRHGNEILTVLYNDSQTSTAKPGDIAGFGLHHHSYTSVNEGRSDLSQIPEVGVPILQCVLSEEKMSDGSPIIATQPSSAPCMIVIGNNLQFEPAPNGPVHFTYVDFNITSEREAGAK